MPLNSDILQALGLMFQGKIESLLLYIFLPGSVPKYGIGYIPKDQVQILINLLMNC